MMANQSDCARMTFLARPSPSYLAYSASNSGPHVSASPGASLGQNRLHSPFDSTLCGNATRRVTQWQITACRLLRLQAAAVTQPMLPQPTCFKCVQDWTAVHCDLLTTGGHHMLKCLPARGPPRRLLSELSRAACMPGRNVHGYDRVANSGSTAAQHSTCMNRSLTQRP